MSRTAQRSAVVSVLAVALATVLAGCFGGVGAATDRVASELEQLSGVTSAVAVTAEPGLENPGASTIRLGLTAGITGAELEDVIRQWAELAPGIPQPSHLIATLPGGDRLEVRADAATDAVVQESATWLALAAAQEDAALQVIAVGGETWSAWKVRLAVDAREFPTAVERLRDDLTERGRTWDLAAAGVDDLELSLSATVGFPPDSVLDALAAVIAATDRGIGPTSVESLWYPDGSLDRLSIQISVEPPDLRDVPSNELLDSLAGGPVETLAAELRDGVTPPGVATRLALRVFDSDDYLVLDNAACAGQPGCSWTVG